MKNPLKFIQDVKQEAFKVTWPTAKETVQGALMVFAMAVLASLFFLLLDQVLKFFLEIIQYLAQRIKIAHDNNIVDIIVDPGFGFGKTLEHNFEILNNLEKFNVLDTPILAGFSRKSMIYKTLKISSEKALNGTSSLNTIALTKGAKILRVHDVKEAKECIILHEKTISSLF